MPVSTLELETQSTALAPDYSQLNGVVPCANGFPRLGSQTVSPKEEVVLGWRYVRDPADPTNILAIELTAEDLLHPQEGDEPVHSSWHSQIVTILHMLLREWCALIANGLILCDQGVKWKPGFGHGPDICFFLNAPTPFDGATFYVFETEARPQFVLEVVSHSTTDVEENDTVRKVEHYYEEGVPQYVLIDREEIKGVWVAKLTNYVRGDHGYVIGQRNNHGHIALQGTPYFLGEVPTRQLDLTPTFGLFNENGQALMWSPEVAEELSRETAARIEAENKANREASARQKSDRERDLLANKLRELGIPLPTLTPEE